MKTKQNNIIFTALILFLAAAFIIPASANAFQYGEGRHQFRNHGREMGGFCLGIWKNQRAIQYLDLNNAQIEEIKNADFNFKEKRIPLTAELKRLRLEMDKAFSAKSVDEKALYSIAKKISESKEKLFLLSIEARLQLTKILNPDQAIKLWSCNGPWKMRGNGKGPNHMQRDF